MEAASAHYPVAVIGSGPIGLTLVNLLGRLGVRCLIVERNATTVQEPRAVSIDDESLRSMQAAGVVDEILKYVVPGYGSHYYSPNRICFAKVEPTGQPYGYPRRNAFRYAKHWLFRTVDRRISRCAAQGVRARICCRPVGPHVRRGHPGTGGGVAARTGIKWTLTE